MLDIPGLFLDIKSLRIVMRAVIVETVSLIISPSCIHIFIVIETMRFIVSTMRVHFLWYGVSLQKGADYLAIRC